MGPSLTTCVFRPNQGRNILIVQHRNLSILFSGPPNLSEACSGQVLFAVRVKIHKLKYTKGLLMTQNRSQLRFLLAVVLQHY